MIKHRSTLLNLTLINPGYDLMRRQQTLFDRVMNTATYSMIQRHKTAFDKLVNIPNLEIRRLRQETMIQNFLNSPVRNMISSQDSLVKKILSNPIYETIQRQETLFNDILRNPIIDIMERQDFALRNILNGSINNILKQQLVWGNQIKMKPLFASALSLTTYNSAVEELASLYKDTKDKKLSKVLPLGVTEDKAKDFLNEFLVFCKKVGAVFNTMESSKLWKVISTIMTLHSIFSLIFDKSNPVCNINSNAVDSEYQVECEENYDDSFHCEHDDFNYKINIKEIEIDLGKRT